MSYILCITEKPSVARDIARILGAGTRHDGFIEGNGYCVTWTFGHLCCLKEPHDYNTDWRRWTMSRLPMIPPRFGIKVIHEEGIEKQFKVIESLAKNASKIINCGDAGQEGELIQRWVMQKAGVNCPVERLWISSLTDDAVRAGFQALVPANTYDNLYLAGLSRAVGDWILGINATRLYTLKYSTGRNILSVGRVQTPTLSLIVARCREIQAFKSSDYYELRTLYRDVVFNAPGVKYPTEDEGRKVVEALESQPFNVVSVEAKQGREAPERLFDLTSLQVECNKRFGWTAQQTLDLIQSLYEKKVTTYPRVDTTFLSDDIYPKIPGIMARMTPYANIIAPLTADGKKLIKPKRIFDSSKVTDHHAIIPTGESPKVLIGDERQLYHLIARRFIAAFYPDCTFETTTVMAKVGDTDFKATGKVITSPGWREIYANDKPDKNADKDKNDESDDRALPPMHPGESGPHAPFLKKTTTQPPKNYTEATLLRAMETAGKTVDDPDLRDALKQNGIGRPSTRAAIIETLFKRRYIERKGKSIIATPAGCALIDTINEPLLKSAKLTGIWENRLRQIERGEYSAQEFITGLKDMIGEIVLGVMRDNDTPKIEIPDEAAPKSKSRKSTKK